MGHTAEGIYFVCLGEEERRPACCLNHRSSEVTWGSLGFQFRRSESLCRGNQLAVDYRETQASILGCNLNATVSIPEMLSH